MVGQIDVSWESDYSAAALVVDDRFQLLASRGRFECPRGFDYELVIQGLSRSTDHDLRNTFIIAIKEILRAWYGNYRIIYVEK